MSLYAPVAGSALFRRLQISGRPDLLAKVDELRGRVDSYLRGVGATFSHYTSHAVDHSDQIVRELSALLFRDGSDQESITAKLNPTETYLLLMSAYLHDVGMVVTDEEKIRLLSSTAWQDFAIQNPQINSKTQELQRRLTGSEAGAD